MYYLSVHLYRKYCRAMQYTHSVWLVITVRRNVKKCDCIWKGEDWYLALLTKWYIETGHCITLFEKDKVFMYKQHVCRTGEYTTWNTYVGQEVRYIINSHMLYSTGGMCIVTQSTSASTNCNYPTVPLAMSSITSDNSNILTRCSTVHRFEQLCTYKSQWCV